jgi:hypothetical protein
MDEIEKGLSGSKSSGASDGGTSARVFGTLLNWMQEKTAPVFIVGMVSHSIFIMAWQMDSLKMKGLPCGKYPYSSVTELCRANCLRVSKWGKQQCLSSVCSKPGGNKYSADQGRKA